MNTLYHIEQENKKDLINKKENYTSRQALEITNDKITGEAKKRVKKDRYKLLYILKELVHKDSRVKMCMAPGQDPSIKITNKYGGDKAFFSGFLKCGNSCICPICIEQEAKKNQKRISQVFEACINTESVASHIVFTIPHETIDTYQKLKNQLNKAFGKLKKSKEWVALMKEWEMIGDIKTSHTTFNLNNGWHPHIHDAIITKKILDKTELLKIFPLWVEACKGITYKPPSIKSFFCSEDFHVNQNAISYMSGDWSAAKELSRDDLKAAETSEEGYNWYQILEIAGDNTDPRQKFFKQKAREFIDAKKGRIVCFAKGLKKWAEINQIGSIESDQVEDVAVSKTVLKLEINEAKAIGFYRVHSFVLTLTESNNIELLKQYIANIKSKYLLYLASRPPGGLFAKLN